MFLSPNLLGALATSATALLSLSFVFATTCQEVLGSCVFLFIKHPYDVGDYVIVDDVELVVERISLLHTVFTRVHAAQIVQTPNLILNSLWVDNISRSKAFKEQALVQVAFNTDQARLLELKKTLESLARKGLHSKGLINEDHRCKERGCKDLECEDVVGKDLFVSVETVNVVGTESLEVRCEMHYRTHQSDAPLRATIRSTFMDAVVGALSQC